MQPVLYLSLQVFRGLLLALLLWRGRHGLHSCIKTLNSKQGIGLQRLGIQLLMSDSIAVQCDG